MRTTELEGRAREALIAVTRTHIQTGEPVGSRTISKQWNEELSPATIRNIMLELEESGYLEQPHTSAGRVPTDKAYRFLANQCDVNEPPSKSDEALVRSYFAPLDETTDEIALERISRLLSLISNNLGVVVRQPIAETIMEHIHFVHLNDRRVMVVLVSGLSVVRDHVIALETDIPQAELDRAANYLNENFRGWSVENIRAEMIKRLAEERAAYDKLLKDLDQLYSQGMLEANQQPELFLEGASNLIGQPEMADPSRIKDLLKALEEKETLVQLITECLRNKDQTLQVVIGLPGKPALLRNFALIGTTCTMGGSASGTLAILGPARMNYERVIRTVGFIGRLFRQRELN